MQSHLITITTHINHITSFITMKTFSMIPDANENEIEEKDREDRAEEEKAAPKRTKPKFRTFRFNPFNDG